jgi:hypothetical protein
MPFPPPSPGVQTATLYVEQGKSPTQNELRVYRLGLPALRRVRVAMRPSPNTNQMTVPGRWWCSCRCQVRFPKRDLGGYPDLWLAPSLVTIPPTGAGIMSVFEVFLPRLPEVDSVTFYFSTELKDPALWTDVWGYPDGRDHNFDGFFLTPYGSGVFLRRAPGDGGDDDDEHALELETIYKDRRKEALERINPTRPRRR